MVKSSKLGQSNRSLVSTVMNSHTRIIQPAERFVLKSSSEFASRSVNIFNSLNYLEMDHKDWMSHNETYTSFEDHNNNEVIHTPANEFKKPFAPLPQKRKANLFSPLTVKRNMKKWIKYSLADVPISSDATNAAVALEFLSELRKKKDEEEMEVTSSTDEKIVFSKPKKLDSKLCDTTAASGSFSLINEISDQNSQCSQRASSQKAIGFMSRVTLQHLHEDLEDS